MTQADMEVPARYFAPIATLLAPQGIDFGELLRSVGMSPQALTGPHAMIRVSQVDRMLNRVVEVSGRTDIGFALGQLLTVGSHTFVGFAMLNSKTLDEALRFEARYFRLIMPSFDMRYRSDADSAELMFSPRASMSSLCLKQHLEGIAMAALREIGDLTDGRPPHATLDFSIPAPAHAERYRHLPGVKAQFGSLPTAGLCIRLLASPARYSLPIANPQSLRLAEEQCQALLRRTAGRRAFAEWVTMTLREVSEDLPSLDELAVLLSVSKRTLSRYLEREGTSYRELANGIKHELACERLAYGTMTVSQVAFSLGFTETSNFTRAFRARAGCSPSEYLSKAAKAAY